MVSLTSRARRSRIGSAQLRPSIREVVILAAEAIGEPPCPGEPIAWAGRSYRVLGVDSGDYLHIGPGESSSR